MTLGQRIAHIRQGRALSQEEFGARLGVTRQTVSKWELDLTTPTLEKIVQMSRAFSVSTEAILCDDATVQSYEKYTDEPRNECTPQSPPRWIVVYGRYDGMEMLAVDMMTALISEYVDYLVEVVASDEITAEKLAENHPVLIGTTATNRILRELTDKGVIAAAQGDEGYDISVGESHWCKNHQMLVISANTAAGVYYGAADLADHYFGREVFFGSTCRNPKVFSLPFTGKMPRYHLNTKPAVKNRALWTWGHCIYDYRRFFENMARLRLNEIVIWNDFAPVNARRVVECAHGYGIRVLWGFSWGWDDDAKTQVDVEGRTNWNALTEHILTFYEENYRDTGADGIYFQAFTETPNRTRGTAVIAQAVTEWVNAISERFYKKYPDLRIQFGLHATSVKNDLQYLKAVNPNMEIIWENCGSFPYSYDPNDITSFEQTYRFSEQIATLRGADDKFGVVIKGMTTLCWDDFEHFKGPYVLGCQNASNIIKRADKKSRFWRLLQYDWIKNAEYPYRLLSHLSSLKDGDCSMQMLVEDGMLEEHIYPPVALLAEMFWNTKAPLPDLLDRVLKSKRTEYANFEY